MAGNATRPTTAVVRAPRVLVVDDHAAVRALLWEALAGAGYQVLTAADGAAALAVVQRCPPDLIFLDREMPGGDGPAFAAAYRALPGSHAPIVAMTAGMDAARYAHQIGADDALGKPFRVAEVLACAARLTRLRDA
jgi:CheY-like chemotaxis protein